MGKIGYLLDCAAHMDYKELLHTVSVVHQESGKNRAAVLADMIFCAFRYGAGFNDYLLCQFYNLTPEQRATYVTRTVNNALVSRLNDREYYHVFDNKKEFYARFSDCLGRDWLDFTQTSQEDFERFMEGRREIMVKPDAESGGKGVERLCRDDFGSLAEMYRQLKEKDVGVIEDVIVQHPDMAKLNPNCLNTLRVVTILNGSGPHIVYAHVRIGNSDRPVDNLHSGGMFAPIQLETGKIQYAAYDKNRNTYETHPLTGTKLQGFQIPFWEESKALCLKAALVVPQMRYVGWDVGVTPQGPVFVEGNNLPGYDILQMPPHTPDKIGMLPRFREFVDGI